MHISPFLFIATCLVPHVFAHGAPPSREDSLTPHTHLRTREDLAEVSDLRRRAPPKAAPKLAKPAAAVPKQPAVHKQPVAAVHKKPVAAVNKKPIAAVNKKPVAAVYKRPVAAVYKKALAAVNKKPVAAVNKKALAAVNKKPVPVAAVHKKALAAVNKKPPVSAVHKQPVAAVHKKPVAAVHKQPVAAVHKKPVAAVHKQPVAAVHRKPIAAVHKKALIAVDKKPVAAVHKQPVAAVHKKPVAAVHKKPVAAVHKKPVAAVHKQPVNKKPVAAVKKKALAAVPKKPVAAVHKQPLAAVHKKPVAAINKKPVAAVNKKPVAAVNKKPVAAVNKKALAAVPKKPAAAAQRQKVAATKPAAGANGKTAAGAHQPKAVGTKAAVEQSGAACGRRVHRRSIYNDLYGRTDTCEIQLKLKIHATGQMHTETITVRPSEDLGVSNPNIVSANNRAVYKIDEWNGQQGPFIAKHFNTAQDKSKEAINLAKVGHLIAASPKDSSDDNSWAVMKHVPGKPLIGSDEHKTAMAKPEKEAKAWMEQKQRQLVNTVTKVWADTGLLHGDLKNDNVHWEHHSDGTSTPHLLDFGQMAEEKHLSKLYKMYGIPKDRQSPEGYALHRAEAIYKAISNG